MLYIALLLTTLLAILHFLAHFFYFYWIYWWFDVCMHFLAGLAGGAAAYGVLSRLGRVSITRVLLSFVVIAGTWEIFEYVNGLTYSHEGYVLDTIFDLLLGSTGAVISAYIGIKREKRESI